MRQCLQQSVKSAMMFFCLILLTISSLGFSSLAQSEERRDNWHSTLPGFPEVPLNLRSVNEANQISRSSRRIGRVTTINTPRFGVVQGFRVTAPDGSVFFVDNIQSPNCAVYARYVDRGFSNTDFTVVPRANTNSVSIGSINFDNCR